MYFHLRHYPMGQCTFTSLPIVAVLYFLFIYYLVVWIYPQT